MVLLKSFLVFLVEHLDLVYEVYNAMSGGMTKEEILAAIREKQVAATKAAVEADLGPRT